MVVCIQLFVEHLNFNKVCAHWVPQLLTDAHKNQGLRLSFDLLERYSAEGAHFLSRTITGDETWLHNFTSRANQLPWYGNASTRQPLWKSKLFHPPKWWLPYSSIVRESYTQKKGDKGPQTWKTERGNNFIAWQRDYTHRGVYIGVASKIQLGGMATSSV